MQRIVFTQENILLMQALTPLFQGRKPVDIFTQFCRAKLQRTVNPLCLSYPLLPSAARWFPPLIPIYFNFLFFMLESKKKRFTSENITLQGGIRCAQKNGMKVWIFTGSPESFFFGFPHGFL